MLRERSQHASPCNIGHIADPRGFTGHWLRGWKERVALENGIPKTAENRSTSTGREGSLGSGATPGIGGRSSSKW